MAAACRYHSRGGSTRSLPAACWAILLAEQAKRVWSLFEGINHIAAPRKPNTALAKLVENRLTKDSSHHRRAATPLLGFSPESIGKYCLLDCMCYGSL